MTQDESCRKMLEVIREMLGKDYALNYGKSGEQRDELIKILNNAKT